MNLDIKLDNLLIDKNYRLKICDFGLSRQIPVNGLIDVDRGSPGY